MFPKAENTDYEYKTCFRPLAATIRFHKCIQDINVQMSEKCNFELS